MVIGLFIFSFAGPLLYTEWGEIELDTSGKTEYSISETTYTVNGKEYTVRQTTEKSLKDNFLDGPSATHILGTDNEGYDIFVRLMYGGRISLTVSFIAVFLITILGVILGGIAGYFGGAIDNIIMRLCDILICLPGIGNIALDAMNRGDIPFIMGYNMFLALLSVLGVLLADLMYGIVDPRVKLE